MIIPDYPLLTDDIDHTKEPKAGPELQATAEQTAAQVAATIRDQQEKKGFVDLDWLETGHADG